MGPDKEQGRLVKTAAGQKKKKAFLGGLLRRNSGVRRPSWVLLEAREGRKVDGGGTRGRYVRERKADGWASVQRKVPTTSEKSTSEEVEACKT